MSDVANPVRGGGRRIGIVVSRFNDLVTERLLSGARACLAAHNVPDDDIATVWVPGAWELPLAAQHMIRSRDCDAVIALGCIIRGDTPHFDFVADAAATGLTRVSLDAGVPVAFGVLTTDTMEQALARAGGKVGNKGWEAALALLEMADVMGALGAAHDA